MRKRSITTATALAVFFSSAVLVAGATGTATADTDRAISLSEAWDTVVDSAHQRLFFSDRSGGKIVATDLDGQPVGTLTGLRYVQDLDLTPDGGTLYAAVAEDDKIVAIDPVTLKVTAEYPTGTGSSPSKVAYAGGKLWFSYGDQWDSGLGSIDVSAATPTVTLDLAGDHDFASPPMLYAVPGDPNTLLTLDAGISSGPIVVYDISTGTPSIKVSAEKGGFYNDAALTPDGKSVVVAGPGNRALTEYRLADLAEVRTYPVPDEPETVSIAPDGTVAATVMDTEDAGDTYVFSRGADQPASVRNLSHSWMPWFGHTMNWSPDGSRLFVLTGSTDATRFHAVDAPRKYAVTASAAAPAKATRGKSLTVTGTLKTTLPLPAGTPLTVTRTDLDSPDGKSLGTKSLGTGGKFSFTDTPPAGGKVTYKVTYAGDATYTAASASDTVEVSRSTPTLTLNKNGNVYSYGADVSFTAHLGTTYKNRTVEIWANPYGGDKPNKLIRTAKVNSSGNVSATVDMKRDTTVSAVFAGDARYAPKTVKVTAYARVKVSNSISKHYKTGKIGSHSYYWFHKKTSPVVTTTMSYYKGRKERLELEVYYNGKWYGSGAEYFKLGTDGKVAVGLGSPGEAGVKARVRTSYINNSSGDNVNSTTHSSWKYLYFSN
ncbi:Ig-like domain repeat protein [Streptomyces sp. SID8379]|uniref:YncE family protein n=1 Tax=unclassified Streptomyces TaxID=2593676 RepID=UPI00036571C7|nr:hypothetical protein [Streptomyces sp. HmicA12]MYW67897.1 Ig-like domain repeat protein [Streptomyces sp. SID8379]